MPLIPKHPRIAPTAPPFDDDTRAALDILGPPIALFGVFARRPDRAHAISGWGRYYLSRRGALSLRHRELAIDRTTALCGAGYEWGIHIAVYAGKAGLIGRTVRLAGHRGPNRRLLDRPCRLKGGNCRCTE